MNILHSKKKLKIKKFQKSMLILSLYEKSEQRVVLTGKGSEKGKDERKLKQFLMEEPVSMEEHVKINTKWDERVG